MTKIRAEIREALIAQSDPNTKASNQRFFKEALKQYGLKSAQTKKISQTFYKKIKDKSKAEIFNLCEQLWSSGYIEEAMIAALWTEKLTKQFVPEDISTFSHYIDNYVNNWATCDTFCNHSVGNLITMYPELITHLKQWAKSENMWLRRAAAVSLIVPAKKGLFLTEVFKIADLLLSDTEDLVQKGYGWMLKVAAHKHETDVFEYVLSKKSIMPRTALRYAIEKMPQERRKEAMAK